MINEINETNELQLTGVGEYCKGCEGQRYKCKKSRKSHKRVSMIDEMYSWMHLAAKVSAIIEKYIPMYILRWHSQYIQSISLRHASCCIPMHLQFMYNLLWDIYFFIFMTVYATF